MIEQFYVLRLAIFWSLGIFVTGHLNAKPTISDSIAKKEVEEKQERINFHQKFKDKPCAECHQEDRQHRFQDPFLKVDCGRCHVPDAWKQLKTFHRDFLLKGAHQSLNCHQCHKSGLSLVGQSENCRLCHQKDDPHGGFLDTCEECHSQVFWNAIRFNHFKTGFPLIGPHEGVPCHQCHKIGIYRGLGKSCSNCHGQEQMSHPSSRFEMFLKK